MDITTLKITSGVPIPASRGRGGSGLSALFKSMKPGDSVFIPLTDDVKQSSLTSMCHTAAKNAHIRVTIRKAEECPLCGPTCKKKYDTKGVELVDHRPILGYRVWRVDDPSDNTKPDGPRIGTRRKGR